jgi:hypothetical protein
MIAIALGVAAAPFGLEHGYFETRQSYSTGFVTNAIGAPCDNGMAWHPCEPALTVVRHFPLPGRLTAATMGMGHVQRGHTVGRAPVQTALTPAMLALIVVGPVGVADDSVTTAPAVAPVDSPESPTR